MSEPDTSRKAIRKIPDVEVATYLASVRERLRGAGFADEAPPEGSILKARRRELKLSRFGIVETVVVISSRLSELDADQLRAFGAESVGSALEGKARLPGGFGSSLVVYPVFLVAAISDEMRRFAEAYVPKHWAIVEFPVLVELTAQTLVVATKTPVWGVAYYRKTRREARDLFAPV